MVRTRDPKADWSAPVLVKKAVGNIDPSPLWDDDGRVYLVHAFANSRAGVSHVLHLQELTADGSQVTKNRNIIINGLPENHTLEGPKFYKRNGYYYIFAPAGGVSAGWQMVYRAKNPFGPYEGKRVLEQGTTDINGPHQGGWVDMENGENWFVHFQERQPYGRVVHLQPVRWINDWPVIGNDEDGGGTGIPVMRFRKPAVAVPSDVVNPQTSDEFNTGSYNLAWQWQANYYPHWFSLTEREGYLRLYAQFHNTPTSLWLVPNILAQKLPAPEFTISTKLDANNLKPGERAGLVMMGMDYASMYISRSAGGFILKLAVCRNAHQGYSEIITNETKLSEGQIFLKGNFNRQGECHFTFSRDNQNFIKIGEQFKAREGKWIGAKIGIFVLSDRETGFKGYADIDWFRIK
jgi:beta-xylosidase